MWLNYILIITLLQVLFIGIGHCIGFTGQVVGIPSEIESIQDSENKSPVLNGVNFQSRFNIELIPLNNITISETFKVLANKDFVFKFSNLETGSYELLINSYDFLLSSNRYRILVEDQDIKAYEEDLGQDTFNFTSEAVISQEPLIVPIKGIKQYYEHRLGSILNMLLDSPFGFIFKNKIYTILFVVCSAIMVTPYIISWVNPDFAEHFQEVQERAETRKREERSTASLQKEIEKVPNKRNQNGGGSLRQRR
ncbi:uncharacterized protein AC631_02044 [Debaryomyces fabryi]|uniref:ER membrane protein complex subunit 7 beta-sandwich domain-containing protein n=1 Tax=Debaryomyces fabryi TaxID=58627 RepID=A0A0V1Q198_9ASCO|nr:uncharacterized protein AC631_02044 [Debaryomyces fabryi]KSA02226.1 hypothetical protein AC631_02044 [Debaryomyces fabryi]CUM46592.1 unnamed protein product [Debaryomyces fabryi]